MPKRILTGKIVKKSGDKTVSVLVTRQTTHPIYKKIMRILLINICLELSLLLLPFIVVIIYYK